MKPRTFVMVLILFLVLLFAVLNWGAFSTLTTLNVLTGSVEAPLGIVMLMIVGVVSLVYLLILGKVDAMALLEYKHTTKELEKARKLADSNEESRFKQLQSHLEIEFEQVHQKIDKVLALMGEKALRETIEEEGDELVKRIGEAEEGIKDEIHKSGRG